MCPLYLQFWPCPCCGGRKETPRAGAQQLRSTAGAEETKGWLRWLRAVQMGAPGAGGCGWGQQPLEAPLQAVPQLLQLILGGPGGDPSIRAVLGVGMGAGPWYHLPSWGGAAVWGTHTGGGAKFQSGAFWGYNSIFTGFMLGCGSNAQLACHQLCPVAGTGLGPSWGQCSPSPRPGGSAPGQVLPVLHPAPEEDRAALMETQLPCHDGDSALPLL